MHTLYGYKGSGSAAVECALNLAQVPYQTIDAATWAADSALDRLRQVNPLGQIPTLVLPDGTVLTESAAILIHLGLQSPASGLLSAQPSARAAQLRGLVYIAANCYSAIGIIDYPARWLAKPAETAQANLKAGTRARLHAQWDAFADCFAPTPWLSGDAPGALDILAAVVSRWGGARRHLQHSRPVLARCLAAVDAHPPLRPVFDQHWGA